MGVCRKAFIKVPMKENNRTQPLMKRHQRSVGKILSLSVAHSQEFRVGFFRFF